MLSSQEIRHAMHQNVSDFLKRLAESKEFLDATQNKIDIDRMMDRDFVNRFLAFYLLDYSKEYLKEDDLDSFMNRSLEKLSKMSDNEKESIRYTGFLAQEVQQAALLTGYDFSGVSIPKNKNSLYGINYAELVVPLVKAVQELKVIVEQQQNEIILLKEKLK